MVRPLLWMMILAGAFVSISPLLWDSSARPVVANYHWRRTTEGWEQVPQWEAPNGSRRVFFHPLSLAALQLTLSLLALSGCSTGRPTEAAAD